LLFWQRIQRREVKILQFPIVCPVLVFGLGLLLVPPVAEAQTAAPRPSRPIFGSGAERPGARQTLDLNATLVEVYDDNVLADQLPGGDPRVGESGFYPMGSVDLQYLRRARQVTVTASAGTGLQYYRQFDNRLDRNHHGALGLEIPLGTRTRVRLDQTAAFATYYTLMGLPGSAVPLPAGSLAPGQELLMPSGEFGVSTAGGWEHHTGAAVTRQIGRGNSLDARYGFVRTNFALQETTRHETGLTYRHSVGRQAALRAGYGYQTGAGALAGEPLVFHNLDFGLDYQRNLTRSRSTSVSLSTGSAIVAGETSSDYRLLADARLIHLMGRSWSSSLGYHRGLEFVGALAQLVASDAVIGTLNGLVSSAVETSLSATYSKGHVGSRHGDPLNTYSIVSRVQYAVSRRLAVDVQYLYYYYRFGEGTLRPIGVAQQMARQSVRGGISFWLPVIR
jgi:hypothetical protein